jgi:uncharacterized protein YoxC
MTPLAQAVITVCIVLLTLALCSTLLALRKTALRAESVLHILEGEIRPMATQIESLAAELRTLSHQASEEIERIGVVVRRVEEATAKIARLVVTLGGFGRFGQAAGIAAGLKRGLDVFLKRIKEKP